MRTLTFSRAINEALAQEMRRDPNVYIAGQDLGAFGGLYGQTVGLIDEFGEKRIRETPISESIIIGSGVGAAAAGLRPVVEVGHIDFLSLGLDQLCNMAAKMRYMFGGKIRIPLVVRTTIGGGVSAAAQHSQCL